MPDPREQARKLARKYLENDKFLDWFEALYARNDGDTDAIPWAHERPNPHLVEWLEREELDAKGKDALVVGCGLGDDAEKLASLGFDVTAFDIAPTAIEWCKRRFPKSKVDYVVADLLDPPEDWARGFDFIYEAYTVQSFPLDYRDDALGALAHLLAPDGRLLVICRGRDDDDDEPEGPPWPVAPRELHFLRMTGLGERAFEDFLDGEDPPVRRFRAEYAAPGVRELEDQRWK